MSRRAVTSHDVARLAGVSRATVSIVLNRSNSAVIGEETRRRVEAAAAELGYRPNSAARMLKSGVTETIGLVISERRILRTDAFVPILFWSAGNVIREHGYHLLLESLDAKPVKNPYRDLVESRRIDGLLVLNPPQADAALAEIVASGFPVVLVGTIEHPDEVSVNIQARTGLRQAVDRLVALGHRRFGHVAFSPAGLVATERRIAAIRRALAAHGLGLDDADIRYGDFSAASGHAATCDLMRDRADLTALLAGNDTIAIGVLSALRELGRDVPRDVSVVGFDDLPFAAYLSPPLTTVSIDAEWQGRVAAEALIALLAGRSVEPRQVSQPSSLVWRASTAPVTPPS